MQVKNLQEPFAHSIIDNFFDDAELPSVFSEINYLHKHSQDTKRTGDPKSNRMNAVHLDMHYKQDRHVSSILRYNRKIFELKEQLKDNVFANYLQMCNLDVTQLNCYDKDTSYGLHPDHAVLAAVTLLYEAPKRFTGGELQFTDYGYTPKMDNNTLVLFPSFIQHEVKPVIGEGRYSINHFFFVQIR